MSSNTLLNFDINYEDIIRTKPDEPLGQDCGVSSLVDGPDLTVRKCLTGGCNCTTVDNYETPLILTGFIIWLLSLWISLWALLYLAWEKWAKTRNDMDSGWSVKKAMIMPKFLYLISPVLVQTLFNLLDSIYLSRLHDIMNTNLVQEEFIPWSTHSDVLPGLETFYNFYMVLLVVSGVKLMVVAYLVTKNIEKTSQIPQQYRDRYSYWNILISTELYGLLFVDWWIILFQQFYNHKYTLIQDNFITTKAIFGVAYYGCVICNYFGFLYDMWYGVETQLKNKVWKQFEYNRFAALLIIIGIVWINCYRLVLIVTNAQDGSSIHADCFYYYQESNAIYLDPYNLQCLTPQDFIFIVAVLTTTVASLLVLPIIEMTERKPLFLIRKSKMIKPEDYESLF